MTDKMDTSGTVFGHVRNVSATDELRRLLDERGVEHVDAEDGHTQHTWWSDGDHEIAASNSGERLAVYNLTPEQAIDATLGRGTCKLDFTAYTKGGVDFAGFRCDGCGFTQAVPSGDLWGVTRFWSYCPNCGKRVVE